MLTTYIVIWFNKLERLGYLTDKLCMMYIVVQLNSGRGDISGRCNFRRDYGEDFKEDKGKVEY